MTREELREALAERLQAVNNAASTKDKPHFPITDRMAGPLADECIRQMDHARRNCPVTEAVEFPLSLAPEGWKP